MDFVPPNIIKTPDFGAMAQNAMQQKRQDIKEMNDWMDANKKKEGAYLEGDKPAVQDAWNVYQQQLDKYVESESRDDKRAADEAYGAYVQIAGTALANAEQYRGQVAAYKADPSKFSISGQDFLSMTEEYRRTKRSANQLTEAIQNPFIIPQSMKYDLSDPVTQSQKMLRMSSAKIADFYNADGTLNRAAARSYAEKLATATINANETSVEKAMAWGGVRAGYAGGEDGIINSMEELDFLRNQPEEVRAEFINNYQKELVDDFMRLIPNQRKKEEGTGKAKRKLGAFTDIIVAADVTPEGLDKPGTEISGNFLSLPNKVGKITAIGVGNDGNLYVTEETVKEVEKEDPKTGLSIKFDKISKSIRRAEPEEVSRIVSKYGNTYDLSSLSGNSVSSQSSESQDFNLDEYYEEKGI